MHTVVETEPVISAIQVGSAARVPQNEIGVFKITAQGNRALRTNSVRFEITGSYDYDGGFGPSAITLDRANAQGERSNVTLPVLARVIGATSSVSSSLQADAAAGTTVLDLAEGAVGYVAPAVGDTIAVGADTNDGKGYLVTAVNAGNVTISPALATGQLATTAVTTSGTGAAYAGGLVQSGTVIEFVFTSVEEIAAGTSKQYVVLANTTNIKNNTGDNSASTQVRMKGSKARVSADNALSWQYTRTNGSDSSVFTLSDSYIVSGKNIQY
jgi:hypothetical protein